MSTPVKTISLYPLLTKVLIRLTITPTGTLLLFPLPKGIIQKVHL